MTIAIHRRFRNQRTIIGIGVVAVLTMATVAALQFNSRPITVTDDPAPAVTQMPQNEGLESVQSAGNARTHQEWRESKERLESIQNGYLGSGSVAQTHHEWLESIEDTYFHSGEVFDPVSTESAFVETPGGGLVPSSSPMVPRSLSDGSTSAASAQPGPAGDEEYRVGARLAR